MYSGLITDQGSVIVVKGPKSSILVQATIIQIFYSNKHILRLGNKA